MNRKERRATLKHGPPGAVRAADGAGSQINKLFLESLALESAGKLDEAARAYKRVVALNADHAEAHNNLARVLHAQGKTKDASASYARALALMPQLFQQYSGIRETLTSLLPQLDEALRRQMAAWPKRSSETGLFGEVGTCCDRGQSVAANFSAIDAGARRCVRAPAHRAARFTCERCNGRQAGRRTHPRLCLHARTTMLHQRICFRDDARRRDKDRRTQARARRQLLRARCKSPRSRCTCRCTHCRPLPRCSNGNGIRTSRRC